MSTGNDSLPVLRDTRYDDQVHSVKGYPIRSMIVQVA